MLKKDSVHLILHFSNVFVHNNYTYTSPTGSRIQIMTAEMQAMTMKITRAAPEPEALGQSTFCY